MTGYYVRIKRGEKWEAVELDKMTDDEVNTFFVDLALKDPAKCGYWAACLARWIRDNVGESP